MPGAGVAQLGIQVVSVWAEQSQVCMYKGIGRGCRPVDGRLHEGLEARRVVAGGSRCCEEARVGRGRGSEETTGHVCDSVLLLLFGACACCTFSTPSGPDSAARVVHGYRLQPEARHDHTLKTGAAQSLQTPCSGTRHTYIM